MTNETIETITIINCTTMHSPPLIVVLVVPLPRPVGQQVVHVGVGEAVHRVVVVVEGVPAALWHRVGAAHGLSQDEGDPDEETLSVRQPKRLAPFTTPDRPVGSVIAAS